MLASKAYLDMETRTFLNACYVHLLHCSSSLLRRILDDKCLILVLGRRHKQNLSYVDMNMHTLPPDSILWLLQLANTTLSPFGGMVQWGVLQTVAAFRPKNQ